MMIWTMSRKYKLFLFCVRLICHLPELIWWSRSRVTKKLCQSLRIGHGLCVAMYLEDGLHDVVVRSMQPERVITKLSPQDAVAL